MHGPLTVYSRTALKKSSMRWFFIGLSIAFILLPVVIGHFRTKPSLKTVAIHEFLSEFGSISLMIYIMVKLKRESKKIVDPILLAVTFCLAAGSDLVYYFSMVHKWGDEHPLVVGNEFLYLANAALLAVYLGRAFHRSIRDKTSNVVGVIMFALMTIIQIKYLVIPLADHLTVYKNTDYFTTYKTFYMVMSSWYSFFVAAGVAFAMSLVLLENRGTEFIFLQFFLLQEVADLGIRYLMVLQQERSTVWFEIFWQIAMAGYFITFLWTRKPLFQTERRVFRFYSFRGFVSLTLFTGMCLFVLYLSALGQVNIKNAFQLANVMLGFLMIFCFANVVGLFVSKKVLHVDNLIPRLPPQTHLGMATSRHNASLIIEKKWKIGEGPRLYEIEQLVARHDALVDGVVILMKEQAKQANNEAIVRTAQMMAHDVRKPFSLLKIGLGMLSQADSLPSVKQLVAGLTPRVDSATSMIDHMVKDIIEVGRQASPLTEDVALESLISTALTDVFQTKSDSRIDFKFDLKHDGLVHVDPPRILRVLTNIIDNAVEAMNGKGKMSFHSRALPVDPHHMMQISIANTNSFIDAADVPNVFEAFYTKGKKSGTGLGLAIVRKIVEAHGGSIQCYSSREKGTRFVFTLPLSKSKSQVPTEVKLPACTSEISALDAPRSAPANGRRQTSRDLDSQDSSICDEIIRLRDTIGRPIRILLVDDNSAYAERLHTEINSLFSRSDICSVDTLPNISSAFDLARKSPVDLLCLGIDSSSQTSSTLDALAIARQRGFPVMICILSAVIRVEDLKHATSNVVDAFLPQPLTRHHITSLLLSVARDHMNVETNSISRRSRLALIEDNIFICQAWKSFIERDVDLQVFYSPRQFWAASRRSGFIEEFDCIITDNLFEDDDETGFRLARKLRTNFPHIPIVLSSDMEVSEDDARVFNVILKKEPVAWNELKGRLKTTQKEIAR